MYLRSCLLDHDVPLAQIINDDRETKSRFEIPNCFSATGEYHSPASRSLLASTSGFTVPFAFALSTKEETSMKQIILLLGLTLASTASLIAQDQATLAPPKVLVIIRENLKPGKAGTPHEKTESAFVSAFKAAKWPQHYLAADSQSGAPRTLFFVGYDSFAAWEKDTQATQKNATLSAALDRATAADGDLLSSYETSTFMYRDDLSYHANISLAPMRYFEVLRFHVKPGHNNDWESIAKMYVENFPKAVPDAHWAVFQEMYGQGGDVYLVFTPRKSLAELDSGMAEFNKFAGGIGPDGLKRIADLSATALDEEQSNILSFNPKMSYAPDEWVKADPTFWAPKAQ